MNDKDATSSAPEHAASIDDTSSSQPPVPEEPQVPADSTSNVAVGPAATSSCSTCGRQQEELWVLNHKLEELQKSKIAVETARDDLTRRQTKYHGTIVQLNSQIQSLEESSSRQAAEITMLQGEKRDLQQQLQASEALLGLTPDRCRSSQQNLREQVVRASQGARMQEEHVKRLRLLVLDQVRESADTRRFGEAEREVLLQANQQLQEELAVVRQLLQKQHQELGAAESSAHSLRTQLEASQQQVARLQQQEGALQEEAQAARCEAGKAAQSLLLVAHERQQAASNLRSAESELADVQSLGCVMFRQVKGILHQLEAHITVYHTRELAAIVRQLREWVARNGPAWETEAGGPPVSCATPLRTPVPHSSRAEQGHQLPPFMPQSVLAAAGAARFVC